LTDKLESSDTTYILTEAFYHTRYAYILLRRIFQECSLLRSGNR